MTLDDIRADLDNQLSEALKKVNSTGNVECESLRELEVYTKGLHEGSAIVLAAVLNLLGKVNIHE